MRKLGSVLAALGVISAINLPTKATEERYHLTKAPKFSCGDVVIRAYTQTHDHWFVDKDGETTRTRRIVIDSTEKQEVISVDHAGRVKEFRDHLDSADMKYSLEVAGLPRETASVQLGDLQCLVRRSGRSFQADTTTVASASRKFLTASQVALLKRFFHDEMDFHAYQEINTLLMPAQSVPVGHNWMPPPHALLQWIERIPSSQRMGIDTPTGSFRLVKVDRGIATVRGTVTFAFRLGQTPARAQMVVSCRIDTKTGRWLSESIRSQLVARRGEFVFRASLTAVGTMILRSGKGEANTNEPTDLNDLGWEKPPRDTNTFRSPGYGFSLTVPPTYQRRKNDDAQPITFSASDGRSVSVTLKEAKRPMDMDELAPIVIGNVKESVPGYKIVERTRTALPGNVPAAMLVATGRNEALTIVTLFAIDGLRLVNISGAVPGRAPNDIAEIKQIVKSLRLFEPDLSATK